MLQYNTRGIIPVGILRGSYLFLYSSIFTYFTMTNLKSYPHKIVDNFLNCIYFNYAESLSTAIAFKASVLLPVVDLLEKAIFTIWSDILCSEKRTE